MAGDPVCEFCGSVFCLLASPERCRHTRKIHVAKVEEPAPIDLAAMTRAQLDAYAEERGIDTSNAANKAAAIELIEGA